MKLSKATSQEKTYRSKTASKNQNLSLAVLATQYELTPTTLNYCY